MEVDDSEIDPQVKGLINQVDNLGTGTSSESDVAAGLEQDTAAMTLEESTDPIVIIMVGMAGTGKTTMTQRIVSELIRRKTPPYTINLDPACNDPPYPVNIDIRDTVKYKNLMHSYKLGPNGAIVTALNLFATKFDEVLELVKQRSKSHRYVVIDTPGQIEIFMWSASGSIISDGLAALFPTVMVYVTDLVSCVIPLTFISNMTYACSILYKSRLPLVVALNKCDQVDGSYATEWIEDFEAFQAVVNHGEEYADTLCSSLSLALDDFYRKIDYAVVSAAVGLNMDKFFEAIDKAVKDYETLYKPMYQKMAEDRKKEKLKKAAKKEKRNDKGEDSTSCFSMPGIDAGAGMSLSLDDADDDTSSDDDDDFTLPENDEDMNLAAADQPTVGDLFRQETTRRDQKYVQDPTV